MKLESKYFDQIRIARDAAEAPRAAGPACQWHGCIAAGHYRAPQGRGREGRFFRFCLAHVREYNSTYNYFAGMSDEELARFQKDAVTGHRPTWSMGNGSRLDDDGRHSSFGRDDPFAFLAGHAEPAEARRHRFSKAARKALAALNLDESAERSDIKPRFKELVKRHHPDVNGGDKAAEDRLREIIQAYNYLKQSGLC